jgi:GTP-binding protein HflX
LKEDRGLGHGVVRERVILAGLVQPGDERTVEAPLTELRRLAETAGAEVAEEVLQKKGRISGATFIGKGKAAEIGKLAAALGAGAVLFNNDLSPAQVRNLEKIIKLRVVDRSEVILDIFALRARSREARVQVELAQHEYLRSRLKRMWTHLERMEGGTSGTMGGIGTRGPGEKQLEVDRRLVALKVRDLKAELDLLERQQGTRSRGREGFFRISLVGYTNAGKSSLLRALTGAEAFVEDRLFATLDTQTRSWVLPGNRKVFLSDTVGFLRNLPHHHVARVLEEIGAAAVPRILVLNKADAVRDRITMEVLRRGERDSAVVSAVTGEGLADFSRQVLRYVEKGHEDMDLRVDAGDGRTLAWLASHGRVMGRDYVDDEVRIKVRLAPSERDRLKRDERGLVKVTGK